MGQNYPNPFSRQTFIEIYTPASMKIELIINDINGKIVQSKAVSVQKGKNVLPIQPNHLISSGLYFYSIVGKDFHLTKRMIYNAP